MITTDRRPEARAHTPGVPAHPHYTLGSLVVGALLAAVLAIVVGVVALAIQANHESVDADVVGALVDERVATTGGSAVGQTPGTAPAGSAFGSVIPDMVPKSQLAVATDVATAYAPNVPPRSLRAEPAIVEVEFDIVEELATIDPDAGVQFETWGYRLRGDDRTVAAGTPGPMIRARVGDVLRFVIHNPETNQRVHNVDFHAVTGQGGGAADTAVAPGESAVIEARMLYPGIFMYHCAAGDVPSHIAHGMYGGILVDPVEPLPEADAEFYIVQSEYYLRGDDGAVQELDRAALTDEHPTMVVFNGAKGALTGDNALTIRVGDRARFYFVNAGLNLDSNFHPIGSHWDAVWPEGATLNEPIRGSQTTLVPAGGGVVVDLIGQVPSNIILVDHALTRTFDKGAIGIVSVIGPENPEIFEAGGTPGAGAGTSAIPEGEIVDILVRSWEFQDQPAEDEFADDEAIPDYSVNVLTVKAGTTVSWVNQDDQQHTVTAVDGSFDSGFLTQGEVFSHTFDTPGEYEYFCMPHLWMRAKVIVEP